MSTPAGDPRHALRQSVYLILAVVSAGLMLGRIFAVDSVDMYGVEKDRMRAKLAEEKKSLEAQQLPADQISEKLAQKEAELEPQLRLRRPFLSANDRSRWCTVRAWSKQISACRARLSPSTASFRNGDGTRSTW